MVCQEEIIRSLLTDRPKLMAYIRAIVLNAEVAADIHQDVVVAALEKIDTISDRQHLMAWARSVAKTKAIDYLRRRQRQPQHVAPAILDLLESKWESEWQSDSSAISDALRNCVKELSPRAKKIVDLRFRHQKNGAQVAQLLGLKLESVHTACSRIFRSLDKCIQQRLAGTK